MIYYFITYVTSIIFRYYIKWGHMLSGILVWNEWWVALVFLWAQLMWSPSSWTLIYSGEAVVDVSLVTYGTIAWPIQKYTARGTPCVCSNRAWIETKSNVEYDLYRWSCLCYSANELNYDGSLFNENPDVLEFRMNESLKDIHVSLWLKGKKNLSIGIAHRLIFRNIR